MANIPATMCERERLTCSNDWNEGISLDRADSFVQHMFYISRVLFAPDVWLRKALHARERLIDEE